MGTKFREKWFQNLSLFAVLAVVGILETVHCCSAEGKSFAKRRAHDYDEHFGFGLMNDDISVRHHEVLESEDSDFKNSGSDLVLNTLEDGWGSGGGDKADSKSTDDANALLFLPDEEGIVYVGCFHSWTLNKLDYPASDFNKNHTYQTCSRYCQVSMSC